MNSHAVNARCKCASRSNWEAPVYQFLNNPLAWTLIALFVSSIGLYCDLRWPWPGAARLFVKYVFFEQSQIRGPCKCGSFRPSVWCLRASFFEQLPAPGRWARRGSRIFGGTNQRPAMDAWRLRRRPPSAVKGQSKRNRTRPPAGRASSKGICGKSERTCAGRCDRNADNSTSTRHSCWSEPRTICTSRVSALCSCPPRGYGTGFILAICSAVQQTLRPRLVIWGRFLVNPGQWSIMTHRCAGVAGDSGGRIRTIWGK